MEGSLAPFLIGLAITLVPVGMIYFGSRETSEKANIEKKQPIQSDTVIGSPQVARLDQRTTIFSYRSSNRGSQKSHEHPGRRQR